MDRWPLKVSQAFHFFDWGSVPARNVNYVCPYLSQWSPSHDQVFTYTIPTPYLQPTAPPPPASKPRACKDVVRHRHEEHNLHQFSHSLAARSRLKTSVVFTPGRAPRSHFISLSLSLLVAEGSLNGPWRWWYYAWYGRVSKERSGKVLCRCDGGALDQTVEPLLTKLLVSMAFTPISCSRDGPDAWILRLGLASWVDFLISIFFTLLLLFSTCILSRCVLPLASGLCYRSQSLLKSFSSIMLGWHFTLIYDNIITYYL